MQWKKLTKLLLLKLFVLLQIPLMAALFGFGAYAAGWNWVWPALAGVVGAPILIFMDDRETWSRRILRFPISTYLQSPTPPTHQPRLPD